MQEYLESINSPEDLKKLNYDQLQIYAREVREFIVKSVKSTGGHLSSNLGTVELSIALHYVFNSPVDKILWDVGHQSYTHKIITGRLKDFEHLRENGGISGFTKMSESKYDAFTMGHASTSLSVGLGLARARDINKQNFSIVSVIGDGAFTGGMAYEAINDIGASRTKMIIILNDNKMSISKNVGAFSNYLAKLRLSKRYSKFKFNIKKGVKSLPFFGDKVYSVLDKTKDIIKSVLQTNKMFESLGIKYYGPIDGHDISNLTQILSQVNHENRPVLLHVVTDKGYGNIEAQHNPSKFHGVAPLKSVEEQSFSAVLGEFLCASAKNNPQIVAISAAMLDGTGLIPFKEQYPNRCYDVGIAEAHAVTLSAGLAVGGCKPYFAVYSTFLQRGFDQVIHDVCLNNLSVVFCIDRAGVVGADGVTHQGLFDISFLSMIPNLTILSPKDGVELNKMLEWSLTFDAPLALRYPKSFNKTYESYAKIELGKWEIIKSLNTNIYILAVGNRMLDICAGIDANIVNCRFIKPLDEELLKNINSSDNLIITLEDNVLRGGFGESVLSFLNNIGLKATVKNIGFPNSFIDNYNIENSFNTNDINVETILKYIKEFVQKA